MYHIFKESLSARINAVTIVGLFFVSIQVVFYVALIEYFEAHRDTMTQLKAINQKLAMSSNLTEIRRLVAQSSSLFTLIQPDLRFVLQSLTIIKIMCFLNSSYLLQHVLAAIFTKKLNRFYNFPTIFHVTDFAMLISSSMTFRWVANDIEKDLVSGLSEAELHFRLVSNLTGSLDFKFHYLLAITMVMLIFRLSAFL